MFAGIDFGTCYSSIAVLDKGRIRFLKEPVPPYSHSWPSSVFLTRGSLWLVGHKAENNRHADPGRYRRWFKRDFSASTQLGVADQWFSPEQLTAEVLRAFLQTLDKITRPLPPAMLTIPAAYEDFERQRMLRAAHQAGFVGSQLVEEPVAAGLYHLYRHKLTATLQPGQFCLVYDLGGGTFDAALIKRTPEGFDLHNQPVGDNSIGGVDFDRLIAQDVAQQCPPVGALMTQSAQNDQAMVAQSAPTNLTNCIKRYILFNARRVHFAGE